MTRVRRLGKDNLFFHQNSVLAFAVLGAYVLSECNIVINNVNFMQKQMNATQFLLKCVQCRTSAR